jgi:hypothetical protein
MYSVSLFKAEISNFIGKLLLLRIAAEVFSWYFCLKAARFFQRRYGHSPGTGTSNYLGDLLTLKSCLAEVYFLSC